MRWRIQSVAGAAMLVGGCSTLVDDPANVPRRGRWHSEITLVALVADDRWIDRAQVPFILPKDGIKTHGCLEPRLNSEKDVARALLRDAELPCTLDTFEHVPGRFRLEGVCGPRLSGISELSGKIEIKGTERPDAIDARVTINMFVRRPSGTGSRVRVAADVEWRRSQDCGK